MLRWLKIGLPRRAKVDMIPDGTNQRRSIPEPIFRGIDFVRQISAPSDCKRFIWGGTMRLIGIDLYKDGLMIRWLFAPDRADASDPLAAAALILKLREAALRDDVGTTFLSSTYASGRSNGTQRAEISFMPAVPADATSLTISLEGNDLTVDIR